MCYVHNQWYDISCTTLYMNTNYQSNHNHLLYNCYLWATCFDSLESSSGPTTLDLFLVGPEDDSRELKNETQR